MSVSGILAFELPTLLLTKYTKLYIYQRKPLVTLVKHQLEKRFGSLE